MKPLNLQRDVLDPIQNSLDKTVLGGEDDTRKRLESNATALEISPEIIKKASSVRTVKNGVVVVKTGLTLPQAKVVAEAMVAYFQKIPAVDENVPENSFLESTMQGKEVVFKLIKTVRVTISKDMAIIIAPTYGTLRDKLKGFLIAFDEYLQKDYKSRGNFFTVNRKRTKDREDVLRNFAGIKEGWYFKSTRKQTKLNTFKYMKGKRMRMNLGHMGISGNESKSSISEIRANAAIYSTNLDSRVKSALAKIFANKYHRAHAKVSAEISQAHTLIGESLGKLNIIFTIPQFYATNQSLGTAEKRILKQLLDSPNMKRVINTITKNLPYVEGSPSFIQNMLNKFLSVFNPIAKKKVKKPKNSRKKQTNAFIYKDKKLDLSKIPNIVAPDIDIDMPLEGPFQEKGFCNISLDRLLQAQGLMNNSLKSQLIANMGNEGYPGGQRTILNNRTGRLAGSVHIDAMIPDPVDCSVVAAYNYQRDPYSIFAEGGKLHTPTNDVNKLISGTIREMAVSMLEDQYAIVPRLV